jgi:hypothetical protein
MFLKSIVILLLVLLNQNSFADLKLTANADTNNKGTKYISANIGGVIETSDSEGNFYRLTIPANALALDMNITLTPLKIQGIAGQENHIGVDITPAGTKLFEFATLEIVPAKFKSNEMYWLETQGDLKNLIARPAFSIAKNKAIYLSHFSGGSLVSGNGVGGAIAPGEFDGSRGWYKSARNYAKQEFEMGKIDKITYDTKIEIIQNKSGTVISEEHQEILENAQQNAAEAIKRAQEQSKTGKIEDFINFVDNINIVFKEEKLSQLSGMGVNEDFNRKLNEAIHDYFKALYANCKNKPIGILATYKAERLRILLGDGDTEYDLDKCIGGFKLIHMSAEYVLNYKNQGPLPVGNAGVNDVKDRFDVLMQISYSSADTGIAILMQDEGNPKTSFKSTFDPNPSMGEGCSGTQTPTGNYEVFSSIDKHKIITAFYNPGTRDLPLPPGYPKVDPSGIIQIEFDGTQETRGWHFTSDYPQCKPQDIPGSIVNKKISFYFDPTKIETVGAKIIESHIADDEAQTSGWVYTYERVK